VVVFAVVLAACTKTESTAPAPAEQTAAPAASASAAPPPAAAPASTAAAPAGGAGVIATADGEKSGVRVEVTELKRGSGGTVNLKFVLVNGSNDTVGFGYDFAEKTYGDISGVHLIDPVGKKKYFVARDAEDNCVCSRGLKDMYKDEQRRNLWAKFPAPPPEVKTVSIVIPHFSPLDDVPISE
jgi:hypothetical protein